jgi:hypothetical protein
MLINFQNSKLVGLLYTQKQNARYKELKKFSPNVDQALRRIQRMFSSITLPVKYNL